MSDIENLRLSYDQLLNADQIADRLNISKPEAFLMMRRGDFPVVRMGRLVRVRESEIEAFIERNTHCSSSD